MTQALPPLKDVIRQHGLQTKKSLGQHFLLDAHITDRIAALAGNLANQTVIEIGPGPGGLTRSLLAAGAKQVIAIEKDSRCLPILEQLKEASDGRLSYLQEDALEVDAATLGEGPRSIIANLPYNVGTDLLLTWLNDIAKDPTCFTSLTLMFQYEVAARVVARPGSGAYGRLSIFAQWLCEADLVMPVPAEAFTPPPKVESAIIQLVPRSKPLFDVDKKKLEQVVALAFQQRRKMLRSALKSLGPDMLSQFEAVGIDLSKRAEQLSIEEYGSMAHQLALAGG